jgi:hypothetical protein
MATKKTPKPKVTKQDRDMMNNPPPGKERKPVDPRPKPKKRNPLSKVYGF